MITGTNTHDIDVYRPNMVAQSTGGMGRDWAGVTPHEENLPATVTHLTAGRAREEFGIDDETALRAQVDEGADVVKDDVVRVVAGPSFENEEFLVIEKRHLSQIGIFSLGLIHTNDGPGS